MCYSLIMQKHQKKIRIAWTAISVLVILGMLVFTLLPMFA